MEESLSIPITKNKPNVAVPERVISAVGGGALALYGLSRGRWSGIGMALLGSGLVYRGVSGQCQVYQTLGVSTAGTPDNVSVSSNTGVKVEKSVTINRTPAEAYEFWRKLENLPQFMTHLESVTVLDEKHSRWTAHAPANSSVSWDAEIITDKPGEMIAWRSLPGADVPNAGSVHFSAAAGERGTAVRVVLSYEPPAGKLGQLAAKLFGEEPNQQVADDLRRFKQLLEAGEAATIQGQPSGRAATT